MTKQTEALKLALEALEVATTPLAKDRQEVLRAQAAIREALASEAIEQPTQTDWEAVAADQALTIALLRAEQPAQQEPVAWWNPTKDSVSTDPVHRHNKDCQPLYTSPPAQRKPWVELDHDDIHALMNEFFYPGMQPSGAHFANFAKAIEAKLKEKNL